MIKNIITSFNFESMIKKAENKLLLYFSVDSHPIEVIKFSISLVDPEFVLPVLFTCIENAILNEELTEKSNYDYSIWKEQKIIRIASENLDLAKHKPSHLQEDLTVVRRRRSDLAARINRQLSYFNQNSKKLENEVNRHINYFNQYHPVIFSVYENLITLEINKFNYDEYIRFELKPEFYQLLNGKSTGSNLIELNYQLYLEIKEIFEFIPSGSDKQVEISSIYESQKGEMKRPLKALSTRRISINPKCFRNYITCNLVEYLSNANNDKYINQVILTKTEFFDLVHIASNQFSSKAELNIEFRLAKKNIHKAIYVEDRIIIILKKSEHEKIIKINIKNNPLKKLSYLLDFVNNVKFTVINYKFPIVLTVDLVSGKLIYVVNNFRIQSDLILFLSFIESFTMPVENSIKSRIVEYISKNKSVDMGEILFAFRIDEFQLRSLLVTYMEKGYVFIDHIQGKIRFRDPYSLYNYDQSPTLFKVDKKKTKLAGALANVLRDYIIHEEKQNETIYSISDFDFNPIVTIYQDKDIMMNCDCNEFRKTNPCYHLYALTVALIREGVI